jgi:tetratricopeptide (TPR) repeat protein
MPYSSLKNPSSETIKQLVILYNNKELNSLLKRGKELLSQYPEAFFIWNILGAALMDLGSTEEAAEAFKKVIYLNPKYADGFSNLGVILKKQGKLEDAAKAFEKAIALKPNYAEAYNNLGVTLEQNGNLNKAINLYKKSIILKPNYVEAYNNLGNVLKSQGKLKEAIDAYEKAISINPKYAEAFNNLGVAFQSQHRSAEALTAYKNAISLKPEYASAYNNSGVILEAQGKFSEASEAYKKALTLKPDYCEAHRNLSNFTNYQPKNSQIGVVSDLLKRKDLSEKDKCNLHYAMAKMMEDLGDFSKAYEHYSVGGALRKKELLYKPENDSLLFSKIKETFPSLETQSIKKSNKQLKHTPVFILGMPRSGTTLVEQIISCHSNVQGAGELDLLRRLGHSLACGQEKIESKNLLNLRSSYLAELKNISCEKPFVTDKMPTNFLYIGLILTALPEAKIIHVKRDPKATCWSNFKHYFSGKGLKYSYDINDTIHFFNLYKDLLQYWNKKYRERIYSLNYEKLTIEQELETKKLIEYIGLDWEDACLSPHKNTRNVQTASVKQVRNRVYTGSSKAWQRYALYLNNIFDNISD